MSYMTLRHYLRSQNTLEGNHSRLSELARKIWRSHWTADVSLLLVAMIWGSNYVVLKGAVETVPVFHMLFIRFGLTACIMIPLCYKALRNADRSTWISGAALGSILFLTYVLETFGLTTTTASNAGFLVGLYVVLVPILDTLLKRQWLSLPLVGILLLCLSGTVLLTMRNGFDPKIGDFLVLGASVGYAFQMIAAKRLTNGKQMDSSALTVIQFSILAIFSGLFSFTEEIAWSSLTPSFWAMTAYLVILGTMFAYYVQLVMIRRTSPSRVALLMSSEPMFAVLFSILFMGEHLAIPQIIGGFLIIAGILLGRKTKL